MNQKGIAKKAGVSQTAVSLVLSGRPIRIAREKREAIFRLAGGDASRRGEKTGTLCYLADGSADPGDPFYQRFISGIQEAAGSQGLQLLIQIFNGKISEDLFAKADGFVIQAKNLTAENLQAISQRRPVALINQSSQDFDSVMPDNEGGMSQVISHLVATGRRRLAFFWLTPFGRHGEERFAAYEKYLKAHDLPLEKERICIREAKERTPEEIVRFAGEFLKTFAPGKRPDAVITGDLYALGMVSAASDSGIRIPKDLALTGYDNTFAGRMASPALTTIDQPMEAMGREAVRLLLDRMEHPGTPPRRTVFPVSLVIRASTAVEKNQGS